VIMPKAAVKACTEIFPAAIAELILQALVGGLRIKLVDVAGKSPLSVHVNVVVEVPGEAGGHTAPARESAEVQVPVVAAAVMKKGVVVAEMNL